VTTPLPPTTGRLLTVCPDVAQRLAVVVLHKIILSFMNADCIVAKALQFENML
jgi:hypothetical protein